MSNLSPTTAGQPLPRRSSMKPDVDSDNRTPPLSASLKVFTSARVGLNFVSTSRDELSRQLKADKKNGELDQVTESRKPRPAHVNFAPAVSIAEPELPSSDDSQVRKQFAAGVAKRLTGRPAPVTSSSRASVTSQTSGEGSGLMMTAVSSGNLAEDSQRQPHHRHRVDRASEKMIAQIADWLQREKTKKETRKSLKVSSRRRSPPADKMNERPTSAGSLESDSSDVSLDRLQRILDDSMAALGLSGVPHLGPHLGRKHHHRKSLKNLSLNRTASSDTEFYDGDVVVPSCDGFLDNSKTMSYTGGKAAADDTASVSSRREEKEKQYWIDFKNEIIRLTHTLRLKGWRRVPLNSGDLIAVERLSGALTNAVYVVSPPPESALPPQEGKKQPTKVLLRIYGPQVEHLIDREKELGVLRRLARKKIGPRLLGTFLNGRFEQFFNATTLTPPNLREPETSKQIAKRMRELHDGVELLDEEKDEGPSVLRNWDKWLDQVEKTVMFLDKQILAGSESPMRGPIDAWKARGFVCGTEWATFKDTVQKYRKFLLDYYGSKEKIREKLVFAHNDTQYGNILRVRPDDEKSPLLQPANEHKQLIVIDFEYAAANVPGLEFANHFSEWTYNYHDPITPHACDTSKYPNVEQQERFIRAYIGHKPRFTHSDASTPRKTPSGTPGLTSANSASSIVEFMLDARAPSGGWKEEEARREEESEKRLKELMEEARLWRTANSAQWVAWGIVQAKIPGLKLLPDPQGGCAEEDDAEAEAEAFDYLAYAQDRALFFWGDCVLMGLVKPEELPVEVRSKLKLVHH
ncbi:kinase-like domain-containing protein [Apodospora peruviana]|uniref:Kinase-like domain-containing protein n=1 Tax=Apodospora peruviana TaxID=516989 RepID=A0AAE0ISS1_9PEZI|nr:kinase-like domain-containing protein [Apodospora peruviana]